MLGILEGFKDAIRHRVPGNVKGTVPGNISFCHLCLCVCVIHCIIQCRFGKRKREMLLPLVRSLTSVFCFVVGVGMCFL